MTAPSKSAAGDDALFSMVERLHGVRPWGAVLDAGTGEHSLRWISELATERWTAVTGASAREAGLRSRLGTTMRPADRIVTGNWTDPLLLHGERFDVVLADYLLGALDGFAPYFQQKLFSRLRPLVEGRLYAIGLEPYPDEATDEGGRLILEIARLRDACILLAGHRCYREYPMAWAVESLESSGFRVSAAEKLPIVYRERFVNGQLDVCRRKLPHIADIRLRGALDAHIESLRGRALAVAEARGGIRFGHDWVIAADPA